jgi:hypothetical protein
MADEGDQNYQTDEVSQDLLRQMRLLLDQVRVLDRVLGEAVRARRSPDGDRVGSEGYREWRTARIRLKESLLEDYRQVRAELNKRCPGFDIKQAVQTTKLLRRASNLLAKLREEMDDLDQDELDLIGAIEEHVREL